MERAGPVPWDVHASGLDIAAIEKVWASRALDNSQKKMTVHILVHGGRQQVLQQRPCSASGWSASGSCSGDSLPGRPMDDLAACVVEAAERIRLRVAVGTGIPCKTLHYAIGVLKREAHVIPDKDLKDLTLLNHCFTALHHFDRPHVAAFEQTVGRVMGCSQVATCVSAGESLGGMSLGSSPSGAYEVPCDDLDVWFADIEAIVKLAEPCLAGDCDSIMAIIDPSVDSVSTSVEGDGNGIDDVDVSSLSRCGDEDSSSLASLIGDGGDANTVIIHPKVVLLSECSTSVEDDGDGIIANINLHARGNIVTQVGPVGMEDSACLHSRTMDGVVHPGLGDNGDAGSGAGKEGTFEHDGLSSRVKDGGRFDKSGWLGAESRIAWADASDDGAGVSPEVVIDDGHSSNGDDCGSKCMQDAGKEEKEHNPAALRSFIAWISSGIGRHDPEWLVDIVESFLCPQDAKDNLVDRVGRGEGDGNSASPSQKRKGKKARQNAKGLASSVWASSLFDLSKKLDQSGNFF